MKLITDSNLELVVQTFYEKLVDEVFPTIDASTAKKLYEGRTLTIGDSAKFFDGSENIFWSLTDIGIGSPSNLTTTNKSNVVAAVNEINANKASISYVDNAVENVTIEDVVTATEMIGELDDVEMDYVTQAAFEAELNNYVTQAELEGELEDALANIGDLDIEGMVTAVDVGNVDIGQGGNSGGGVDNAVIGELSSLQTSNKTNLVGAINELFTNANNGKELIATSIGSPLNSSDTFSAMSTKINNLVSTFKTNLMNKGISVANNDKFQNLISKVNSIETGVGESEEDTVLLDSLKSVLQGEGVSVSDSDDMASLITKVDNEFDTNKQELVNALTAKGVTCSVNEDWSSLVSKINNINTGLSTLSGTHSDMTAVEGSAWTRITVSYGTTLPKTPSRVLVNFNSLYADNAIQRSYYGTIDSSINKNSNSAFSVYDSDSSANTDILLYIDNITTTSFRVNFTTDDYQSYSGYMKGIKWTVFY